MFKKYLSALLLLVSTTLFAQEGAHMSFQTPGHVEIYNFSSLNSLQTGTISFWFKINDLSQTTILFSASSQLAASSDNEFYINYNSNVHTIQSTTLVGGVVTMDAFIPYYSIGDNNWHNYTLVSDNIGAIEIYIDGVAQVLTSGPCCGGNTNDNFFGDVPSLNNMVIGALKRNTIISYGNFAIDDFRIWDKALNSSEITSSISSASVPPVANLVVYYDFEVLEDLSVGITGVNDIRDQTGNAVHGDVIGGVVDNVLAVDPGCYVEMYNFSNVASLQSGSLSFWFKLPDLNGNVYFFSISNTQPTNISNDLYVHYSPAVHSMQTVYLENGVITVDAYTPDNSIADTKWHHYALVSDNTGNIEVYLDGVLQTLTVGACCNGNTSDHFLGDVTGANNMKIGLLRRTTDWVSVAFSIDDFKIYDKALNASEVQTSMNYVSGTLESNLVLYYNFDLIKDLGVGTAGVNDIEDITGGNQNGDDACLVVTGTMTSTNTENTEGIILYPNPTEGKVNVECYIDGTDKIDGTLTNSFGDIIMTWSESASNKYNKELNFTSLPTGIYYIQLIGEKTNKSIKVVKQ